MTGEERGDLDYLGKLVSDARGHLESAQSALATATAWAAIMAGRNGNDTDTTDGTATD